MNKVNIDKNQIENIIREIKNETSRLSNNEYSPLDRELTVEDFPRMLEESVNGLLNCVRAQSGDLEMAAQIGAALVVKEGRLRAENENLKEEIESLNKKLDLQVWQEKSAKIARNLFSEDDEEDSGFFQSTLQRLYL